MTLRGDVIGKSRADLIAQAHVQAEAYYGEDVQYCIVITLQNECAVSADNSNIFNTVLDVLHFAADYSAAVRHTYHSYGYVCMYCKATK